MQTPVDSSTPWPSSRRSLSFAVTTPTRAPARENAARMDSARRNAASFIITAAPVARSRKKLPLMPWTAGGTPVTIDTLLGLVKLGSADDTSRKNLDRTSDCRYGATPAAIARSMYSKIGRASCREREEVWEGEGAARGR